MKLVIAILLTVSASANAFDVLLTEKNPSIEVQTLLDSGATLVNCQVQEKRPYPRCILKLGKSKIGIQQEGQSLEDVSYIQYQRTELAFTALKKLKTEGLCY